ncbi:unnamed protein product [Oikopleura dioica]|uniref:Silk-like protein n=1 Tax=Oikopleura dioica TaxID=34765 RepID=E4XDJ3_OIKDI|nr:unnamed protein product [Oikopleura dioica]
MKLILFIQLSTIFLPVVLSGAPGTGFFDDGQAYWPVLSCESEKGCSVWKIAQKAGWEDFKAAKLTCDLSINKCVCADGFIDKNNDPRDGCEAEAGSSADGETCYFGSCSDDSSCSSFHPGLTCGSSGCCECDPDNIETLGNQQACLKKQEEEPVLAEVEAQPRNGCPTNFQQAYINGSPLTDPLTCCHQDASYDPTVHKCICNGQDVDQDGFCKFCPLGMCQSEFIRPNGEKRCCPGSQIWNEIAESCKCADGSIPGPGPGPSGNNQMFHQDECPGDCPKNPHSTHFHYDENNNIVCCPEGATYSHDPDSCSMQCYCHDNNNNPYIVRDLIFTHCPSNACAPGYNYHYDTTTSQPRCCPGSSYWDELIQTCVCQDGVEKPDLNNQCPDDCATGETLGSFFPEVICCPAGTAYQSSFNGCACNSLTPWTAPDADGNCPFCAVNHHKQTKLNGDEVCCKRNQVWNNNLEVCACPDGSLDQGVGCTGDCEAGEYLVGVSLDGVNQCCPVGSYFENSPCEQRCKCNDANGAAGMYPHPERGCYACGMTGQIAFVDPSNPSMYQCCTDAGPWNECYGDCDPGYYIGKTWNPDSQEDVYQCCPVGSELIYDSGVIECRCLWNGAGPVITATSVNSCTSCSGSQIPFWQSAISTTCCEENRRYFQMEGSCLCIDGSQPHIYTGCDGDCPVGSYLAGTNNECCPIGSNWDSVQEKCICYSGTLIDSQPEEINGVLSCDHCVWGSIHYEDNKNIHCCPDNQFFDGNICICQDGNTVTMPLMMGECPGDCPPGTSFQRTNQFDYVCCPNDGFDYFDVMNDKCMCNNGLEADLVNNVCPLCAVGQNPYEDQNGDTQCCAANQKWNDHQMSCICYDGSIPDSYGECPDDCPYGFNYVTNTPELVCCPEYALIENNECLCMPRDLADRGIAPDPETHLCPRCPAESTEYPRKNGDYTCCRNNLVYDEHSDMCICPDGKEPYHGYLEFCSGDCPSGEFLAEIWLGENMCCPVGSDYNSVDKTCTCFNGNAPDPVSGCETGCPSDTIPWYNPNENGPIQCCEERHVWFPWSDGGSCKCPGDYWGWNGGCEEECPVGSYKTGSLCCPVGANMFWDGMQDVCQCENGQSPNAITGCGQAITGCSEKEHAYMDTTGNKRCCQKNMIFNYKNIIEQLRVRRINYAGNV